MRACENPLLVCINRVSVLRGRFKTQLHGNFMAAAVIAFVDTAHHAVDGNRRESVFARPLVQGFALLAEPLADLFGGAHAVFLCIELLVIGW